MASYATPAQLALHMGVLAGFDTAQTARAQQLLDDATTEIRDKLAQPIESSTDTVTLDGSGTSKLLLPRWPVTAVTSVTEIDTAGVETVLVYRTGYTWSDKGILTRVGGRWPCHDRSVRVVCTAGHTVVPANLARICRRLAAAGWDNPAGADQEQLGDRSVRWNTPGMQLTTAELDTIAGYGVRP